MTTTDLKPSPRQALMALKDIRDGYPGWKNNPNFELLERYIAQLEQDHGGAENGTNQPESPANAETGVVLESAPAVTDEQIISAWEEEFGIRDLEVADNEIIAFARALPSAQPPARVCHKCGDQGDVYAVKHEGELPTHDLVPCPNCTPAPPVGDGELPPIRDFVGRIDQVGGKYQGPKRFKVGISDTVDLKDGMKLLSEEQARAYGQECVRKAIAAQPAAVPHLSEVQIDNIRNDVMKALAVENNGVIGGPDVEHMQFPKRFAKAILQAIGGKVPCCAVCGDDGKWLAGYTGIFGGNTPIYEPCTCAAPTPPAAASVVADARDAERYRYLKDNADIVLDDHVWITTDDGQHIHVQAFCRHETDRAVDAAMGKDSK